MRTHIVLLSILACFISTESISAPRDFKNHSFNGRDPVHSSGETEYHVRAGDCSPIKYGDGRGESDCFNGNLRSRLSYQKRAKLGDSVQYSMEIFVPANLKYSGGPNKRSLLEIAEWQRINTIKNHIHQLHLDSRKGLTFDDARCVSPSEFGKWIKVVMQVRWSMGDDGILVVKCNDNLVVSRKGRTAIPPDCGQPGVHQCKLEHQQPNQPIQFQVGILFRGYGENDRKNGLSAQGRVPPEQGFTIRTRNVKVSKIRFR